MRQNGSFLGYAQTPTTSSASGIWTMDDVARYRQANTWPYTLPVLPITGPSLWLDVSYSASVLDASGNPITVDSTAVATWQDLSGNGYNAVQSTSGNRPTWRSSANGQNNLPVISFNGSSSYLISSSSGQTGSFSVYIVFSRNNSTGTQIPLEWGQQTTGKWRSLQNYYGNSTIDGGLYFAGYFQDVSATSLTASYATYTLTCVTYDGTTTTVRRDGGSVSGTPSLAATTANDINIGRSVTNAYFFNGKICEVLVYSSSHSGTQYTSMRSYFQAKWGTP